MLDDLKPDEEEPGKSEKVGVDCLLLRFICTDVWSDSICSRVEEVMRTEASPELLDEVVCSSSHSPDPLLPDLVYLQ